MEDIRTLTNWVGIVLRNIPQSNKIADDIMNSLNNSIREYGSTEYLQSKDIGKPIKIKGKICAVITLANIELVEHICREWNGR